MKIIELLFKTFHGRCNLSFLIRKFFQNWITCLEIQNNFPWGFDSRIQLFLLKSIFCRKRLP
eukprot:UN22019